MSAVRVGVALSVILGLVAACAPTCPKGKVEAANAYVTDVCALEPLHTFLFLREGAAWAKVDAPAGAPGDGIPLFVYADGLVLDGRTVVDLEQAKAWMDEEVDKARQLADNTGKPWVARALLAIAADTPVRTIAPVIDLVHRTGFTEIVFVAEAGGGPPLPIRPAPEIPAEIAALAATMDPENHMAGVEAKNQLIRAEIGKCPAMAKAFDDFAGHPYETRCAMLGRDVIAACEACACSSDVSRAVTLAMTTWQPDLLLARRVATPEGAPVVVRADETWGAVAPRVFVAAGPVRLQVEG